MENYNKIKYISHVWTKTVYLNSDVFKTLFKEKSCKFLIMVQEFHLSLLRVFNKQVQNTMLMIFLPTVQNELANLNIDVIKSICAI